MAQQGRPGIPERATRARCPHTLAHLGSGQAEGLDGCGADGKASGLSERLPPPKPDLVQMPQQIRWILAHAISPGPLELILAVAA